MLRGLMLQFPFGTDFTADEKRLLRALQWPKQRTASAASAA